MVESRADVAAAAATGLGMVLGTLLVPRTGVQTALDAVGYALLVAGAVPLAWRRRFPLAVVWATAATCVAYYGLRYPGIFASAPVLPAVYTLVAAGRRWQGVTAALAFLAALYLVVAIPLGTARPHGGVAWNAGFLAAAVVIGTMVAGHRAYLRVVEQRAVEAERTREEAALRRAGEERLWIAQELHDTITHSMSVINVHAGVAAHLLDRDPDRARAGLVAIKEASRDVLRELRATLGVLRRADDGVPGMDGLPVLVARARRAGLAAELHVRGVPRPVPDAIGLAAHRIVQEALTNVLRHSGASAVTVSVAHRPDAIRLRVRDDGTPPGTTATHGTGLIGMRERALALGGSFSAGAAPGGGFLVEALLPVPTGPHR